MARKHDTARQVGTDRGVEIGLLARLVIHPEVWDIKAVEIAFYPGNEGQVAVAAGGVKGDELGEDGLGRSWKSHSVDAVMIVG